MEYGEIVTRALAITWRHKYLWLLALFAGETTAGASLTSSFSRSSSGGSRPASPTPAQAWNAVTGWVGAHVLLLVVSAVVILALCIALFLLSAITDGALVRASSEHDAGHPFSLRRAWNAGVSTFWLVLKVKILALLVSVISFVVIGGLVAAAVLSASHGVTAAVVILAIIAVLAGLAAIPFFIIF